MLVKYLDSLKAMFFFVTVQKKPLKKRIHLFGGGDYSDYIEPGGWPENQQPTGCWWRNQR